MSTRDPDPPTVLPFRRPAPRAEPARPFLTDGRCYSDLWGVPPAVRALLLRRQLVFVTTLVIGGESFSGDVIASTRWQAQRFADDRGLGELVVGVLTDVVPGEPA